MGRIRGIPGTPGRAGPGQFCNPGLRYQRGRFAKGVSFLGIMFKFDRIKRLHPGVQNAKRAISFGNNHKLL